MSYPVDDDDQIPDSGAVFTFGKSKFADNVANKFWIKNDGVVDMACGDEHSAVVTESGRLYVFGSNDWGQLGLGHTKSLNKPSFVRSLKSEKVKKVACGRNHTIVYSESGKIFSFGCNEDGQLGHEIEKQNELLPKEIESLPQMEVQQVACGTYHSIVLSEDGDVYVWGNNNEGQLGLGEEVENSPPKKLKFKKEVVSVSCGYYHTALVTRDGFLYTFGENELGKLGLSSSQLNNTTVPQSVAMLADNDEYVSVSCGARHTVAVTKQGLCYAWGDGSQGQLGHGTKLLEVNEPKQIKKLAGHKCISVSCGESHTAVITASGKIFTFGDGRHGKLGHGEDSFSNCFDPVYISRFNFFNVMYVSCGGCHTLVQAVHRNKDDFVDGEKSLRASMTSQKSLKEANMTIRPEDSPILSSSPRNKRRHKDSDNGIEKFSQKGGSLNNSMAMAQLNRTMTELPSKLDRSKLPKIPGLNLSGHDNDDKISEHVKEKNHQTKKLSVPSVQQENKKSKNMVAEVSFSRTSNEKDCKNPPSTKNYENNECEDDSEEDGKYHSQILSFKGIDMENRNKDKNNKNKDNLVNVKNDILSNKLKSKDNKLKKQNKLDVDYSDEEENNVPNNKKTFQKNARNKNEHSDYDEDEDDAPNNKKISQKNARNKNDRSDCDEDEDDAPNKKKSSQKNVQNKFKNKKQSIEDENSEGDTKSKAKIKGKIDSSKYNNHKKNLSEEEDDEEQEEDEEDENNSEVSEEENNHSSHSKGKTNKEKSNVKNKYNEKSKSQHIEKSKSKPIEKSNSKHIEKSNSKHIEKSISKHIEKSNSKHIDKKTTNEKNKNLTTNNKAKKVVSEEDEDEEEEDEEDEEENDNEKEHSEDDAEEDEEEDDEDINEDEDVNEDDDEDVLKKNVEHKSDEDDNGLKKDKKTRSGFLDFFRRKKKEPPPPPTPTPDDNEDDNVKSKACIIL